MKAARLAVVVVALALAACGTDTSGTPTPTAGDDERRDVATEWYLRSISDDGRTINLVYTMSGVASGCERKGSARAEEASDKVVLIAYKSVTLGRNRACTQELAYVEDSVVLDQPLGDRALVGCRPGRSDPSEDAVCRDLERSREHGIFEFSPQPSG